MGYLRLAIGGAVVLVIGTLFALYRVAAADLNAARARYSTLNDAHTVTLETVNMLRLDALANTLAVDAERDRRKTAEALYVELTKGIDDAPNDGCVGPAVRSVFDGMRRARADNSD